MNALKGVAKSFITSLMWHVILLLPKKKMDHESMLVEFSNQLLKDWQKTQFFSYPLR